MIIGSGSIKGIGDLRKSFFCKFASERYRGVWRLRREIKLYRCGIGRF